MRFETSDFEHLITLPGLHCVWVRSAGASEAHLAVPWVDSRTEAAEPTIEGESNCAQKEGEACFGLTLHSAWVLH
jgi:hypothetical protein